MTTNNNYGISRPLVRASYTDFTHSNTPERNMKAANNLR